MEDKAKYEHMNVVVTDWSKRQRDKMRQAVGRLTLKDKHAVHKAALQAAKDPGYKKLQASIGSRPQKNYGQVNRINFPFAKQGIWLEHGVGRGRRVRSPQANPKSWIFSTLDPAINELADLLANEEADLSMGEIKFFIPGIIDRHIKIDNGK
jgi:hypothetical protein